MKMWIRAIQMQADLAMGGNGTGIVCKSHSESSSVRTQKKLRSHTLESELNRKMMELDNLEKRYSEQMTEDDDIDKRFSYGEKHNQSPSPSPSPPASYKVESRVTDRLGLSSRDKYHMLESLGGSEVKDTCEYSSGRTAPSKNTDRTKSTLYESSLEYSDDWKDLAKLPVADDDDNYAPVRIRKPNSRGSSARSSKQSSNYDAGDSHQQLAPQQPMNPPHPAAFGEARLNERSPRSNDSSRSRQSTFTEPKHLSDDYSLDRSQSKSGSRRAWI